MSEFSESYHLQTTKVGDVDEVLRRAGFRGYVLEPDDGWVTFVIGLERFEPDSRVVAANRLKLLHFTFAEDHGWSFALFDGPRLAYAFVHDWGGGDPPVQREVREPGVLADLMRARGRTSLVEFEKTLEEEGGAPGSLLLEAVGVKERTYLSWGTVKQALEDGDEVFGPIRVVDTGLAPRRHLREFPDAVPWQAGPSIRA